MSRTKGKTIKSVEFDNPLLELLTEICARQQFKLSQLVRIACTGFALDYVKNNEGKWAKPKVEVDKQGEPKPSVTRAHIDEAKRSDDAILLALAALTGRSESSMYPERKKPPEEEKEEQK